jgi:hypothetical protein
MGFTASQHTRTASLAVLPCSVLCPANLLMLFYVLHLPR